MADARLGPQVGLEVLRADGNVFACHADREMAVQHGEVGSSAAVLKAGYSLDCLMLRYAGVNWRDPAFGGCNAGCAPPLLTPSATPPAAPLRFRLLPVISLPFTCFPEIPLVPSVSLAVQFSAGLQAGLHCCANAYRQRTAAG